MLSTARIYFSDGRIWTYTDEQLAYTVYINLPDSCRVAFRGCGDSRPVLESDYAQRLPHFDVVRKHGFKHTPGPWRVHKGSLSFAAGVYGPRVSGQDRQWIADTSVGVEDEQEANTTLIAAAPELLDSLGRVTRISHLIHNHQHANLPILPEQWSELSEACTEAIAVIAKAEGRA